MTTKAQALTLKHLASHALTSAQLLFPASTPTSPADNTVQALLERLSVSSCTRDSEAGNGGGDALVPGEDVGKAELLKRAAERGLELLEAVQGWLVLEVEKNEVALQSTDFLLSIQQRALIQRITQHVVAFLLLPTLKDLCTYISSRNPMTADAPAFQAFVPPFLRILALSAPTPKTQRNTDRPTPEQTDPSPPAHTTYITQTFRNPTTLVHLMAASIVVGWYESVAKDPTSPIYTHARGYLHTLGGRTETISVLGGVVRLAAPRPTTTTKTTTKTQRSGADEAEAGVGAGKVKVRWPMYVFLVARGMMARQITMPMGVMGLMVCTFGNGLGKNEVVDMKKLEYLAQCVGTPVNETLQATMNVLSPVLHEPFQPGAKTPAQTSMGRVEATVVTSPKRINKALSILLPLLTSTPPTSTIVSCTITPILPQLFSLAVHLSSSRTADPLTKQELDDVLRAWARLADRKVVVKGIWGILNSGRGWGLTDEEGNEFFWDHAVEEGNGKEEDGEGGVAVWYGKPPTQETLKLKPSSALDTSHIQISAKGPSQPPNSRTQTEQDAAAFELPELDLMPPPKEIVSLLKRAERKDITSTLYVRCLHAYQELAQEREISEAHTKKLLLYLQLIMQITESMPDALGNQTDQILVFIEQALRSSVNDAEIFTASPGNDAADSDDEEEEDEDEAAAVDADLEEDFDAQSVTKLGLMETAIHLLLATLQFRGIARNAKLLLSVKKAMTSGTTVSSRSEQRSSTMEQYQEALRCLQDSLLPVRGHGLIILQGVVKASDFDKALVPAIMDIFLQALRDEDSFMYLNAVRGLSSMVDGLGKEVLQSLTSAYVNGLDGGASVHLGKEELDFRLRIGEALTQSVKRCGTALSIYANVLVPKFNRVFPQAYLPTVLRASSLSILSTCADVDWRAVIPWAQDLLGACLDLLQLESVRTTVQPQSQSNGSATSTPVPEPLNANDGKHPALRRAALTFLGLLFNSVATSEQHERETAQMRAQTLEMPAITMITNTLRTPATDSTPIIHPGLMQKAGNVLGYLQATDVDSLAAHQAGEALYILRQLRWPVTGTS
ncbi:hypothetical protein QFC21_001762 [Naganishia friedmannii]|uniref:Uncharacterized protein n=1 Tax=Naganishia friedmannii TaxID=89922 RepID=A0ACC2W439_9TREE|nr:hypothetical protein QFC21_001762 [Naganishia friedmannii]